MIRNWIAGARLRTLPLAVAPIIVGGGLAAVARSFSLTLTLLALAVAVLLQIGVNYANDYSDGVRGTDAYRVGPARLTGSGIVASRRVLVAALSCFALAAVIGLVAVVMSERWWFLIIGIVAIIAAWFYTGGKHPYGYIGLGEVVVFVFFGLVATAGTYYLQASLMLHEVYWAASGVGLFAVAVLIANNTRDIETDKLAGKMTLSVRIGSTLSRALFVVCVLLPFIVPAVYGWFYPGLVLVFLALLLVVPVCIIMLTAKTAKELILVLQLTSIAALIYAILLAVGFSG